MASDDPFACFGDEVESDVDSNQSDHDHASACIDKKANASSSDAAANRDRGRHLTEAYNANANKDHTGINNEDTTSPSSTPHNGTVFRSSFEDQQTRITSTLWPHRPPLYLGPMCLSDALFGGGRGFVAAADLPPGTCVLIEEPLVRGWSEQQMGTRLGLESIAYLLKMENANSVVSEMEALHPTKQKVDAVLLQHSSATPSAAVEPLDKRQILDMMSNMTDSTTHPQAKALATQAEHNNITNSDGSPLDERDIHRLLLTLRYNGFDSGLYLHFSMFNHEEDPNCIKFRPMGAATGRGGYYSEARTLRWIRKGEALTLHYLENPREVSHATRRKLLFDQHRFDIGGEHDYKNILDVNMTKTGQLFNDNERGHHIFQAELVKGLFPSSSQEENSRNTVTGDSDLPLTRHIENSLDELEDMLSELSAHLAQHSNGNTIGESSFDRAAALELTVGELITASRSALDNDHHILLARCRRLHLNVIALLLSKFALRLTDAQSVELMARFLPSVQSLLKSQRGRLGNDHPDVARTYHDFAMGIQSLLAHAPKRLLSLELEGMTTFDQCSRMEHSCRMAKQRIEEFYPRDVDEILNSVKRK